MTPGQIARVVQELEGTQNTGCELADEYGVELEDIEDVMLDSGFERCPECDVWVECHECERGGEGGQPCFSCSPRDEDDE